MKWGVVSMYPLKVVWWLRGLEPWVDGRIGGFLVVSGGLVSDGFPFIL